MRFGVLYEESVIRKDLPGISVAAKKRIKAAIETKLMVGPDVFGKPLRRSLRGYRSLRVGDYRVIYRIEAESRVVKIFVIQHRSVVYKAVLS